MDRGLFAALGLVAGVVFSWGWSQRRRRPHRNRLAAKSHERVEEAVEQEHVRGDGIIIVFDLGSSSIRAEAFEVTIGDPNNIWSVRGASGKVSMQAFDDSGLGDADAILDALSRALEECLAGLRRSELATMAVVGVGDQNKTNGSFWLFWSLSENNEGINNSRVF